MFHVTCELLNLIGNIPFEGWTLICQVRVKRDAAATQIVGLNWMHYSRLALVALDLHSLRISFAR